MPSVSVIVPTYNRADLLRQTIRSVLAQSYHDFELVVVDDGSTDNTGSVVQSFGDDRIVYIGQANQERCAARNNGISKARSAVVAFLDDDDLLFPDALAAQMAVLDAHPEVGVVYSHWARVDTENRLPYPLDFVVQTNDRITRDMRDELLIANPIPISTAAVRKNHVEEAGGFDPSVGLAEDWDLWIRIAKLCKFCEIAEPLAACRVHPGNSVGDPRGILRTELEVLDKGLGLDSPEKLALGRVLAFGRRSAQALSCGMLAQAEIWLQEAVELASSFGLRDELRNSLIAAFLSNSRCNRCDLTHQEGLIRTAAYAAGGLKDRFCGNWLASYWVACSNAAFALGDYRLCLWCLRNLRRHSLRAAMRRGSLGLVRRSLAGLRKSPQESAATALRRTLQAFTLSLAE